ncbi:MAG: PfkB family carbohydrate kinase [Candidatus Sedimenticola sp. (ex Thyasira tokunagai)]
MSKSKVLSLTALAEAADSYRREGRTIGLCHGTFDLLHVGHIRHFQQAAEMVDVLLVTVTGDAYVNKGPDRPVFTEQLRAEHIAALGCVESVAVNQAMTGVNVLELIKPDIYIKGEEYRDEKGDVTGNIRPEEEAVERHGGELHFTGGVTFSSSQLLNCHFNTLPEEVSLFLRKLKAKLSPDDVVAALDSLKDLRVLVVGESIIDEYHYVEGQGKPGKNSIMAVRYREQERFAGGAIAVANHIAAFAGRVTLASALGEYDRHEEFIRSKLQQNIDADFYTLHGGPTLRKRRYVQESDEKLFEVYYSSDTSFGGDEEARFCRWLEAHAGAFDLVVVPDYGNGLISSSMVEKLTNHAGLLAVNTQINSANRGYHFITRYSRADFVALNEPELRMAFHDRHSDLELLARKAIQQLSASHLAVTRGSEGLLFIDQGGKALNIPALSTKVLDRIGAGDAFLSLASICIARGVKPEVSAFIGAAAAALDVQIVCNREPVSKASLAKYLTTLLK